MLRLKRTVLLRKPCDVRYKDGFADTSGCSSPHIQGTPGINRLPPREGPHGLKALSLRETTCVNLNFALCAPVVPYELKNGPPTYLPVRKAVASTGTLVSGFSGVETCVAMLPHVSFKGLIP